MTAPCRLCGADDLRTVVDLGASPPCELFLTDETLDHPETTLPLHLRVCAHCLFLQLPDDLRPEDTFVDYAYYSSYSSGWVEHARRFVEQAVRRCELGPDTLVVEVASNDGYLLQHVVAARVPCLGVEPSVNVGAAARMKGVPTLTTFLTPASAEAIVAEHGPARLVVANNVWAHVPDLHGFTAALRRLLADDGQVSIEVHHARELMRHAQFDTIYHEHYQYWTVHTARRALAAAGLVLVEVELLPTHGGSLRLWARPQESRPEIDGSVARVLALEEAEGLHTLDGYRSLAARVSTIRDDLATYLIDCRRRGLRVAGYGAPGKANTLLNHAGIRPDLLPYLVDRNPYKHGRHTPGTRIPIRPVEALTEDRPDRILIMPWNLRDEITDQLGDLVDWPARLVVALPTLTEFDLPTAARRPVARAVSAR